MSERRFHKMKTPRTVWSPRRRLGWRDLNARMQESKSCALTAWRQPIIRGGTATGSITNRGFNRQVFYPRKPRFARRYKNIFLPRGNYRAASAYRVDINNGVNIYEKYDR